MLPFKRGEDGKVKFQAIPKTDGPLPIIAASDIGYWALAVFKNPEEWIGKDFKLCTEWLTPREIVKLVEEAIGEPISVDEVDANKWKAMEENKQLHELWLNLDFFNNADQATFRQVELSNKVHPNAKKVKDLVSAWAKFRGNPPIGADGKRGRVIDFTHGAGADIKDETDDEELEVMEGRGWKLLKKEEIPPEEVIDIFTAIERFNRRKRGENAMDGVEMSTPASKKHGHQDGPDRRSGSAESASFARPGQYPGTDRSHGGVARPYAPHPEMLNMNMRGPSGSTTSAAAPPSPLPSPTGSPAPLSFSSPRTHYSPHHPPTPATASMGQPTEHLSSLTAPGRNGHTSTNSTVTSTTGGGVTGGVPLQPDMQLTTLLALPSLLTHFTLLPPNLQSHVILTLLRQSPLPVLRSINSVLAPTLSRDFLTQLPAELVSIVLSYLPGKTLAQCTRVSKAWRAIIDSDPILWRELLRSTGTWFGGGPERAFARTLVNRREVRTGMRLHHHPHNHRNPLRSSILSATSSNSPSTLPSAPLNTLELPHPYKVLFKSRQLTRSQWATNQNPKRVSFAAHGSSVVTCLLFSHNRIISASDDHSIHVYNPLTGQLIKSLEGHGGGVWALAATKDTLVSGSTDRTVRIWDLEKGRCTHVFGGHKSTVRCLAIVKPELLDMVDPNAADGIGME
ncbi:SCF ubiquitin ligase complex subunit cdc4, partial [Serendipita sp. 398]